MADIESAGLQAKIAEDLSLYSKEIIAAVKKSAEEVSKQTLKDIRNNSPRKSGDYKRAWKSKKTETANEIDIVIYNSKKGWLTHLLEFGHVIKNGTGRTFGKTAPRPHIRPAEEKAIKEFTKKVEEAIKGK